MVQASLGHRTQSSVSLSVARECARQRMRATMTDSHPRLPRQTGVSQTTDERKPVHHDCSPDWHPRLHRRRGIEARPHSEEMHDRLDGIRNDRGDGGRLL